MAFVNRKFNKIAMGEVPRARFHIAFATGVDYRRDTRIMLNGQAGVRVGRLYNTFLSHV